LDGEIWALKADSLTSPLIVTVTERQRAKNNPWNAAVGDMQCPTKEGRRGQVNCGKQMECDLQ